MSNQYRNRMTSDSFEPAGFTANDLQYLHYLLVDLEPKLKKFAWAEDVGEITKTREDFIETMPKIYWLAKQLCTESGLNTTLHLHEPLEEDLL